jgi:hypothetical protein
LGFVLQRELCLFDYWIATVAAGSLAMTWGWGGLLNDYSDDVGMGWIAERLQR